MGQRKLQPHRESYLLTIGSQYIFRRLYLITLYFPFTETLLSKITKIYRNKTGLDFLVSTHHNSELNPASTQVKAVKKPPLTWNFCTAGAFFLAVQMTLHIKRPDFLPCSTQVFRMLLTCFIFASKVLLLELDLQVRCFTICLQASVFPEPLSPL